MKAMFRAYYCAINFRIYLVCKQICKDAVPLNLAKEIMNMALSILNHMKAWKTSGLWKSDVYTIGLAKWKPFRHFQNSFNSKFPSPAPLSQQHFGSPVVSSITLWLICWSLMHSLCCNRCSLVALLFMFLLCFGRRESEDKAYQENRTPRAEMGLPPSLGHAVTSTGGLMWFLNHQHHPRFCIGCPWLEVWVVPISGERRAGEKRKQRSTCRDMQTETSCQNFVFKWWRPNRKEKKTVQKLLKSWWRGFIFTIFHISTFWELSVFSLAVPLKLTIKDSTVYLICLVQTKSVNVA